MIEEIQVLGAGTILPLPGYGCSGYVVRSGGRPILMDCGSGTLDRLAAAAVPVESIDLVLITHFHPDHVADLGPIILSRWLRNLGGSHELTLVGPVGLSAYLEWLTVQAHPWIDDYRLNIVELGEELPEYRWPGGEDSAGALTVRARRTVHTDSSICYRLTDDEGTVLFYSGDTDYDETLTSIMKDADLAVVECSKPDDKKLPGHLTPRLAGKLAAAAEVRKLLLTHFYEEVLEVDIEGEVRAEYHGPVAMAAELARHRVK